jgi:hypothetical protein
MSDDDRLLTEHVARLPEAWQTYFAARRRRDAEEQPALF